MSTDMIAYVLHLSNPQLTRPEKTLLLAIAYHTNYQTGVAYPGYRLLAQECLVTERQIINLVHRLEKHGVIEVRRGQGRGHLTVFKIHVVDEVIHRKGEISGVTFTREKVKSEPKKVKSTVTPIDEVEEKREKQTIAIALTDEEADWRRRYDALMGGS